MIRANGNLDIICLQRQTGAKTYNLPSWVPDWSALAEMERPWLFKSVLNNSGKNKDDIATMFGTIDTSYGINVRGNILHVSGRFFGTVDGLSTSMSHTNELVGEMVQPTVKTSAYTSGYVHAAALHDALIMLDENSDSSQTASQTDFVHYLSRPIGLEVMSAYGHDLLAAWLVANSSFEICNVGLDYWTRLFYGNRQWKKRLAHHFEDKASFAQDMHKYMTDIETVLKGGMRLMTSSWGHIGMAHPQTRTGDHICLLEGMGTPVILRPCSDQDLGTDAVTQLNELKNELKVSRYTAGMMIETSVQSYKVVGEAYIRMGGMVKDVQEFAHPFLTFCIL